MYPEPPQKPTYIEFIFVIFLLIYLLAIYTVNFIIGS
jgi:hypothetical protein